MRFLKSSFSGGRPVTAVVWCKSVAMRLFGKPKLSEAEAAGQVVMSLFRALPGSWPSIADGLRPMLGDDASVLDDDLASYEFALAALAIQLQALPNLLPADQARRIRGHVLECLAIEELGTYPQETIAEYQQAWDDALRANEPPHIGIASVLFDNLGCSGSIAVGESRFKDPLVLMSLGAAVLQYGSTPAWKILLSKFKLVP